MIDVDVTHLVVNGCSWTYGEGLENPNKEAWPALLANHFGLPIVNLAVQGCGNQSITRRTFEYVYENLPTGSKPFFVISWSQDARKEETIDWVKNYEYEKNNNSFKHNISKLFT
mgnify:CR=1 FL=1